MALVAGIDVHAWLSPVQRICRHACQIEMNRSGNPSQWVRYLCYWRWHGRRKLLDWQTDDIQDIRFLILIQEQAEGSVIEDFVHGTYRNWLLCWHYARPCCCRAVRPLIAWYFAGCCVVPETEYTCSCIPCGHSANSLVVTESHVALPVCRDVNWKVWSSALWQFSQPSRLRWYSWPRTDGSCYWMSQWWCSYDRWHRSFH